MLKNLFSVSSLAVNSLQAYFAAAYCSKHDLEVVYGGGDYLHSLVDMLYAMDEQTFDLAVSGGITLNNGYQRTYFYFIENRTCTVKWHYLFDNEEIIFSLAIRSQDDAVYGILDLYNTKYFLNVQTDISHEEELSFQLYKIDEWVSTS